MYKPNDKLSQKARQAGFRARSVFKLEEINNKYRILKPGQRVLDLGASPGSWMQYTAKKIGAGGSLTGLDLKPITNISGKNIKTLIADVYDDEFFQKNFQPHSFDVILSDMAPNTSGIKFADSAMSLELGQRVLEICQTYLKPKGQTVIKIFASADLDRWFGYFKKHFLMTKRFKPSACRESSKEFYLIGQGFKNSQRK